MQENNQFGQFIPGSAHESIVEKAEATQGDKSDTAATGNQPETNATYISYETPAKEEHISQQRRVLISTKDGVQEFLEPPEDPQWMYNYLQLSALLGPVIDALETNVYKPGYVLKPTIALDRPAGREQVKDALMWRQAGGDFTATVEVTDKEVDDEIEKLRSRAIIEKQFLKKFFEEAVPDMSFRKFMIYTGQDKEVTGNTYWEVSRNTNGKISRMLWVSSIFMRATPQEEDQIATTKFVRDSVLEWTKSEQIRRFRKYGQIFNEQVVAWFKEFGDPRVMSRNTGKYYEAREGLSAIEVMNLEERGNDPKLPDVLPATEILHIVEPFGGSTVYGKPKFSGTVPGIVGSRDLDEENLKIASDEAIPSMIMLVAGGTVGAKSMERLASQIKQREKGRKGIMIIEAQSAGKGPVAPTQQPTIQIEKTKASQSSDALFQNYDKRNEEKVAGANRMPRALLGKDLGQNRATTVAMLRFAEEQVFKPKREDIDSEINSKILADLDITCWTYQTRSMQPRDPQILAEILQKLTESGLITPNEGRDIAAGIFNEEFEDLEGLWAQFPPRVLTVLLQTKNQQLASILLGNDPNALNDFKVAMENMEDGNNPVKEEGSENVNQPKSGEGVSDSTPEPDEADGSGEGA